MTSSAGAEKRNAQENHEEKDEEQLESLTPRAYQRKTQIGPTKTASCLISYSGSLSPRAFERKHEFPKSEMRASPAQLEPSTWVTNYIWLQLDLFNCGDGKARLSLSSTIWSFAANTDSGNQRPLFQEDYLKKTMAQQVETSMKIRWPSNLGTHICGS
ncbi:hypothetical protein HPG69_000887 [Diceros bicornis minor]|uniref:Uncharacterized protein n=1 Tax=Diceros bicornis minor TaxID=77932 RepID=A0A7J7E5I1_DICBM|nr:hypothetical protein HPG69_000887 [Diceros bicornis minor]